MDRILLHLQDPAWWFDLFIVGVIVAIIAGLLVPRVDKWTRGLPSQIRGKRQAATARREAVIASLVNDPTYLTLFCLNVVIGLLLFVVMFMLVIYLRLAQLIALSHAIPDADLSSNGVLLGLQAAAMLLAILTGFIVTSRLTIASEATVRYRAKHGLPGL